MPLLAFPLQSNFIGFDDEDNPLYDRAVNSVFYRGFWSKYWTDGIFFDPSDNFKVSADSGMQVIVKLGECHIQGLTGQFEPDINNPSISQIILLDPAEFAVDRIDRIVIRADFEINRIITIEVRKNWESTDVLTRNSNIWELGIADVLIKKGTTSIPTTNITDLRLNTSICGIVTEPIKRTNTEVFFQQIQAEMTKISNDWQSQMTKQKTDFELQSSTDQNNFNSWFNGAQTDIVRAAQFDFDNLASIPGNYHDTIFNPDGSVLETIKSTSSNNNVAKRITIFNIDETMDITEIVWRANGIDIQRQSTIHIDFKIPNISVRESITGYDLTAVSNHNVNATAHQNMIVDGNLLNTSLPTETLAQHEIDPDAHENLIIDGNEN